MQFDNALSMLKNKTVIGSIFAIVLFFILFDGLFFYAEPGYQYHVRTIAGTEKVVNDTGYSLKLFGRVTEWKKALTVQSVLDAKDTNIEESASATIAAFSVVFLGNVDARIESTARFRLPTDPETFLSLAREYRTPENFINTALIPAMKDTLQSTASLMTADEFYSGGRAKFSNDFETQLANGLYVVERIEISKRSQPADIPQGTAIAQLGQDQGQYGDQNRVAYEIRPVIKDGVPVTKRPKYHDFGVSLVESRITNVIPNGAFQERMRKVQEAAAALAVAKQERLKEEEQKLLVQTRGEREQEEERQAALKDQAVKTTTAETAKQLAIVAAEQRREQAELDKQTSQLLLDKAQLDAQATKTTADADAYARERLINADNGLQQKLDAWVSINKAWAEASSNAPVPAVMFAGQGGGTSSRSDEFSAFMGLMGAKAARDLAADVDVKK